MKTFRKRWGRRVRRYAKRAYKYAKTGYRIAKEVAALKMALNVEKKYHDRLSLVSTVVTSAAPALLALPWDEVTQGTDRTQRIGHQIKALWTTFRTSVEQSGDACSLRMMVIHDKEPRGTAAFTAISLRDAVLASTATGPLQITSPYRVGASDGQGVPGDRFKIIMDRTYAFDNVRNKQAELRYAFKHTWNRARGLRIKYRADTDEPLDDRLYILALSDAVAGASSLTFSGDFSRMCFVDN